MSFRKISLFPLKKRYWISADFFTFGMHQFLVFSFKELFYIIFPLHVRKVNNKANDETSKYEMKNRRIQVLRNEFPRLI